MRVLPNVTVKSDVAPSQTPQSISGFTLFEFIVVMILVGILSVYVVIKLPSTSVFNLSSVTEQVRRDIRYTQSLALSLNTSYSIVFSTNSYSITPNPPAGAYTVNMPSGITLSPITVTFNSLGTPSAAASVTVTATGVASNVLTITAETGFVNG